MRYFTVEITQTPNLAKSLNQNTKKLLMGYNNFKNKKPLFLLSEKKVRKIPPKGPLKYTNRLVLTCKL